MMSSVDGRLLPERFTPPFNGKKIEDYADIYFKVSSVFNSEGIIIGRNTLQQFFIPGLFENKGYPPSASPETYLGRRTSKNNMIVLDAMGKTLYAEITGLEDNIIAILSEKVSDQYLSHLRECGVSYVFAGEKGDEIGKAMDILAAEFGISRLLLEGGGIINGLFLKAGLIDELSLMVYPGIDGLSGAPSIFEYLGAPGEQPAKGQLLEYVSTEVVTDGIVWIRYNFHKV